MYNMLLMTSPRQLHSSHLYLPLPVLKLFFIKWYYMLYFPSRSNRKVSYVCEGENLFFMAKTFLVIYNMNNCTHNQSKK